MWELLDSLESTRVRRDCLGDNCESSRFLIDFELDAFYLTDLVVVFETYVSFEFERVTS